MEQEFGERICKRCLLREMADSPEMIRNLREYIENLESDVRTGEKEYEERLLVCKQCERLLSGMCRACGCYVEWRAAVAKNTCPCHKW